MSLESMGSHMDEGPSLKDSPEYLKKLDERVQKIKQDQEHYKQLVKVNDVLNILDFPDNKEDAFRKVLEKQDDKTLKELAGKTKNEILIFLIDKQKNQVEVKKENVVKITEEDNIQTEKIEQKISKIKSVLTPEILQKYPKINEALEKQDIQKIIDLLKVNNGEILKSIINDLGGADKNNPKYVEFKNTLIGLDPSFENEFNILENTNHSIQSANNEVVSSIENDSKGLIKVDLNADTPTSKMSLDGSDYSFDKEIDKEALTNINAASINKLTSIENSFAIFKGLYKPFGGFINQIKQDLGKEDFKQTIKNTISNSSQDIFSSLDEHYETLGIESSMQLSEADITNFATIDSPSDLQQHIDRITAKFKNIEAQAGKMKAGVLQNHKTQMKELIEMKDEQKEKQKKVLEFLKKSGFDLIPKEITNKIIRELQSNTLTIPGLDLSVKNIDIKNGNFGESGAFIDKEAGLNIASKTNIVKFMNKIISGNIDEPLSVQAIANGVSVADPNSLKYKFLEADVVGGMGWKYGRIVENLRKA